MKNSKGVFRIRCECGDELFVVLDSKEAGKAIDDHVDLHLHGLKSPTCTVEGAERLKDVLIAQVLRIASG
jgi:hypothetical protein